MKKTRIFIIAGALLGLVYTQGFAQGLHPDKVDVTGNWEGNLSDMEKPHLETPRKKPVVDTKDVEYEEKEIKAETEYQPLDAKVPNAPPPVWDPYYPNFVKVGYGRFATPFGKLHIGNNRSLKGNVGLDFAHTSSSKGYVDYAEFRDDIGSLKGEYFANGHSLGAQLQLRNSNYFYFADTVVQDDPSKLDSIRETYTRLQFDTWLIRDFDPNVIHYDVGLRFLGFFDNHKKIDKGKDIHFSLLPKLDWKITDQFRAKIGSNLTFSNSEFDSVQQSRVFLDFTPMVTFKLDKLTLEGGLKVNSLTDSTTHFGAYPIANASYELIEKKLSATAGIKGGMRYLQMANLIEENKYIDRNNVDIRPMAERIHLYAGIDGQVAKHLNYSLRAYTKKVKNQLIYFNPEGGAYFQMLYDSAFTQSGVEASLVFNKDDKIRAGLKGDFASFKTTNISHNFNIPNTRVDLWASYNFAKKVWVTTEVYLYGGRVMSLDSSGGEISQGVVADLNLSADYRFTKRISVFLELNNILGNNWQRWYNYRERPFDVKGGVTFAF